MSGSEVVKGQIIDETPDGMLLIRAPITSRAGLEKHRAKECWVQPIDARPISDQQRRTCYALISYIADWMGDDKLSVKEYFKLEFWAQNLEALGDRLFSLSNAPMSLIAAFQRFLVEFIVQNGVPTTIPMLQFVEDTGDYVYACLIHKKCVVCGRAAELHHVERVGMGRDRKDICHEGMEALPLCREHHKQAHDMPDEEFFSRYHLEGGIKLDKTLCKIYRLKSGRYAPKA